MLFGGPSWISVTQTVVTDVDASEVYPYDTLLSASARSAEVSGSKIGFNVGGDVGFMFSRNVGVGFIARFSRASVDLEASEGRRLAVDAGGGQIGGGLRLRF